MGQADLCAERSERAIGLEEGIVATSLWQQHGLQQSLQGRIHPGDANQYGSSTTLLEHQQGGPWGRPLGLRMHALLLALTIAALALLLLWAGAAMGWWLLGALFDPLVERSRADLDRQRILQAALLREQAMQRLRLQRQHQRSALRLHDLDGRPLLLSEDELESFQRRCLAELELPAPCSWPEIRRHWRRQSLIWHPDRGGDRLRWLRRQRAYEALGQIRERWGRAASAPAVAAGPMLLQPRAWWWRWRSSQRR